VECIPPPPKSSPSLWEGEDIGGGVPYFLLLTSVVKEGRWRKEVGEESALQYTYRINIYLPVRWNFS